MSASVATPPAIGHNRPPTPLTSTEVQAHLADEYGHLATRRQELLEGVTRFQTLLPITTDEQQGKTADFVKQLRSHLRAYEDRRTEAKKPFLEGGRAVDAWFRTATGALLKATETVEDAMTAFAREQERKRRAAAEAEARRVAEEARIQAERAEATMQPAHLDQAALTAAEADRAQTAAQARPAEFTRTRGDYGSVASLREFWEFDVIDLDQVPRQYLVLDPAAVRRAIAAGARVIPGLTITSSSKVAVR